MSIIIHFIFKIPMQNIPLSHKQSVAELPNRIIIFTGVLTVLIMDMNK